MRLRTGFFERYFFERGGGERPGLSLQGVEDGETSAGQAFFPRPQNAFWGAKNRRQKINESFHNRW